MRSINKSLQIAVLTVVLSMTWLSSLSQKLIPPPFMQENWKIKYEPFRIAGNLYYVGTLDLACYLITTPQGHILINTGLAESVPMIRSSIESLGFKFSDIKILLATHAHYDHVAGMAEIKKLIDAKLIINENDALLMADGGSSDYFMGGKGGTFEPVKPDSLLHKRDTVKWGGMQIITLNHPGHTKGATSFLFDVKDEKHSYRVLIANMPSVIIETKFSAVTAYPGMAKDYEYTFSDLRSQQFDIWLASHATQFDLHKKRKPGDNYRPEVFIDRAGYDQVVDNLYKAYQKKLD